MSDINEVRERLTEMANDYLPPATGWNRARDDLRALLADHARLRAKVALAADLLERLQEYVPEIPDKDCSCHISPPCNDCVDWADLRELYGMICDFIAEQDKAVQP